MVHPTEQGQQVQTASEADEPFRIVWILWLRVFPNRECWASRKQFVPPGLSSFAEHLEKALLSKAEAYTCVPLLLRPDPGPEDGDGQERGTAVFHEDVHGLAEVLHLQDEVCG